MFQHTQSSILVALTIGALAVTVQGCEEPEQILEACDLTCPVEGILAGNASISGLASVDSFFSAVVNFGKAAGQVKAGVDAELRAIAVSLDLDAGASAVDIRGALAAKFKAAVDGGVKIEYAPPRCTVAASVAVDAAAKCDAQIDPGMATVECKGTCTVDASAEASCDASATVMCKGTAPNLQCEGTCTGTCELSGSLQCEGTCNGTCNGTCSVKGPDGQCAGECMGECQGSCELKAGAACEGSCQGSCEYQAPEGKCEAGAEVRCQASADASASCNGSCDGEVVPPKAKAECEASVEAEAKLRAECTPPSLEIRWQWSAAYAGDVAAQAQFKAWVEGFRVRYAGLLAATARGKLVLEAGAGLGEAAGSLVTSVQSDFAGQTDLRVTVGIACAVTEFGAVATVIGDASGALTGSLEASAEITAAIAGG